MPKQNARNVFSKGFSSAETLHEKTTEQQPKLSHNSTGYPDHSN